MSAFNFRLEAVRKLRKRTEEERAGELAEAVSEAGAAQSEQARLDEIEQAGREQIQRMNGVVAQVRSVQVMMDQIEQQRDEAREKCRVAEEALRERHTAFVQAVTDRRAIERLRERREKAWRQDTLRREQKSLDEVSTVRHVREGVGGGSSTDTEGDR